MTEFAMSQYVNRDDMIKDMRAEIARLTERCEAYKGQVKAGSDEIERLTALFEAEGAQVHSLMVEIERLKRRLGR